MSIKYKKAVSTIRIHFDLLNKDSIKKRKSKKRLIKNSTSDVEKIASKLINLVFDGTFFGRSFGFLIYRGNTSTDNHKRKFRNIYYRKIDSEKIVYIKEDLNYLSKELDYTFKSFTIDGRRGVIQLLKRMYPNVPIQMCQFHQKQIIRRYTTDKPQTKCGIDLKELMKQMKDLGGVDFEYKLLLLKVKHRSFLKEKNENNRFMHGRLRSAFRSLKTNLPYLFTYEKHPELNIPNTTNTCEGWFAHLKEKVKIHRGMSRKRREKMIEKLVENC